MCTKREASKSRKAAHGAICAVSCLAKKVIYYYIIAPFLTIAEGFTKRASLKELHGAYFEPCLGTAMDCCIRYVVRRSAGTFQESNFATTRHPIIPSHLWVAIAVTSVSRPLLVFGVGIADEAPLEIDQPAARCQSRLNTACSTQHAAHNTQQRRDYTRSVLIPGYHDARLGKTCSTT